MLSDQPSETHAIVNALRNVAFEDDVTLVRFLHHDPGRYSSFGGLGETAKYTVGRSMYETDSVPAHWVELCNDASLVEVRRLFDSKRGELWQNEANCHEFRPILDEF